MSKETFTRRNSDNLYKAIQGLDQFAKNWCMKCKETEETDKLVFRCDECSFLAEDDLCKIKEFAFKHENGSNYDMSDFGSMGCL